MQKGTYDYFLSCGKTKADHKCRADEMYKGDLFKKSYEYALSLNPSHIYILSAKYGVLETGDIISPYNLTLNNMDKKSQKIWAYKCYMKLKEKNCDFSEEAVFLCGDNYRKYLSQMFKNPVFPLKGISFGNQLKFYKENTK